MEIKVLGPGCPNCTALEVLVKKAVQELGIEARIEKVTDVKDIMRYAMSTPGLVINGKLRHSGKPLPNLDKVKDLIRADL